jgi:hypothetical protein
MALIIIGDLHNRKKRPYRNQVIDIMTWFTESEYNIEDNELLFLGDLVEEVETPHELLGIIIDFIVNKIRCKKIRILQGNHDCNIEDTILSSLAPLPRVKIIKEWEEETIDGIRCLFLPYYYHESTNLEPMHELYSHLLVKGKFDYVFHHIEDETQNFGNRADLTYIDSDNYLCGHIHSEDVTKGGHYLGSPGFNSYTEKDKTPYIAVIDIGTKKYKLVEVPKFISYHEVSYPNPLPDKKDVLKYPIFRVKESIDKAETLKFYEEEALKKGYVFYNREVCRKKSELDIELEGMNADDEKTDTEWFEIYQTEKGLDKDVLALCLQIFDKRKAV